MKPLISIIIPSKNSSKTIKKLLESIFICRDKNFFEVIVVDSSNDNTTTILKEFPVKIFRVPFTRQRNATKLRNIGIVKAKGEFLYFVDADSFIERGWQNHLGQIVKNDVQVFGGQVSTKGRFFDFYCENSLKSTMRHFQKSFKVNKSNFYKGNWPLAGNLCVKKNIFKKIGKFDEGMENYEEVDFIWRACLKGIDVRMFPSPKVIHSYNKSIVDGMKTYFRYGNGFGKFVVKYPTSILSIFRLSFSLLFFSLFLLFIFSILFAQQNLPYFLIPFIGLFIYHMAKKNFDKKLLFPLFDLIYVGISYNIGVIYSILEKLLYKK